MRKFIRKKYYGIVEGFFSNPLKIWSWGDRFRILKYIEKYAPNINSYFYCPKDEPYVTTKWDFLYPKRELNKLKRFAEKCKVQNVEFIYGFNPQIDSKGYWIKPTMNKINQILNTGCSKICLLFDDIPEAYDVMDNKLDCDFQYYDLVRAINKIYSNFKGKLKYFWICAPDYFFNQKTPLTDALTNLNTDIGLIWSGPKIFVKNISPKDLCKTRGVLGKSRKIILWFNYPVNDCEQNTGMYNLGPFPKIPPEVLRNLSSIYLNPMMEPYSNLPVLTTFSDLINNPETYQGEKSFAKVINRMFNSGNKISKFIQDLSQRNAVDCDSKKPFGNSTNTLTLKPRNSWGKLFKKDLKPLLKKYETIVMINNKIKESKKITIADIQQLGFPTKTNVARYLPEIYKINKKRLSYYTSNNSKLPKNITYTYNLFSQKYIGKQKLKISKTDENLFLNTALELIKLEIKYLIGFLNNENISKAAKFKALNIRQNVNRFFV